MPSCAGRDSAAPAANGTASSRPSSASPRAAPRRPAAHRRPPRPRPSPSPTSVSATCRARPPDRRARPGARWRDRPGSLILVGGEPGIGKSTLLLQVAAGRRGGPPSCTPRARSRPSRFACGPARLGLLARRAGPAIAILAEHDIGRIVEVARAARPALVVVDSIQTATVEELDGAAGSVGQVREAAVRLMEFAKGEGIAVILVGHVTKDGSIAGPKTLEHLVDAVVDPRGRALRGSAPRPRARRTGSARPMRSASSRWPSAGSSRSATRPARSSPTTPSRPRAASSPRRSRAAGRCSSRSRRSSPRRATARRRARPAASTRTGSACSSPSSAGGPAIGLGDPRRLRQPRRRPVRRGAGPGPAGRPGPRVVAARSAGRARHGRRSARSACSASCAAVAGLERRLREAARLGFTAAIVPRPGRGGRPADGPGHARSRSRRSATRSRRALASAAPAVASGARRC